MSQHDSLDILKNKVSQFKLKTEYLVNHKMLNEESFNKQINEQDAELVQLQAKKQTQQKSIDELNEIGDKLQQKVDKYKGLYQQIVTSLKQATRGTENIKKDSAKAEQDKVDF